MFEDGKIVQTLPYRTKSPEFCSWSTTNESLEAIVEGMVPTEDDSILSIGGSGDQALALLEFAGSVVVADPDATQITLIRRRAQGMSKRDDEIIFRTDDKYNVSRALREGYFRERGRLDRISEKIGRLIVLNPMGIAEAAYKYGDGNFNKIYLSNIFNGGWMGEDETKKQISALTRIIPVGGLIYSTTLFSEDWSSPEIEIEFDLTDRSRKIQSEHNAHTGFGWLPAVYKKIKKSI